MHDLSVILTLSGALASALVLGWLTQRLGLSTLVGYMLAGIAVGPFTPGFVADRQLAAQMAEIGVILLMFGVGMHFHPRELFRVWRVAVPGAIAQSATALAAGWLAARAFGWSTAAGLVFGMALAVASTVVLLRMLIEGGQLKSVDGHVAVGWLIVEDLFTVVALVLLPTLAVPAGDAWQTALHMGQALATAGAFALLVWLAGRPVLAHLIERVARTRSRELFTLTVFVLALGVATVAAEVFHVSVALGAFFGGLVIGQSRFGPQATADMAPLRDVFTALFFVSVGMLFDPSLIVSAPLRLLAALAIVLLLKPVVALAIVLLLRQPLRTALTVAVGLAQIGEFSFILAGLGHALGILPAEGVDVLVAAALVSIAVNPLLFRLLPWLEARTEGEAAAAPDAAVPPEPAESPTALVLLGADPLARQLADRWIAAGFGVLVLSDDVDTLRQLGAQGAAISYGDPRQAAVLEAAGAHRAAAFVITGGSLADKMRMCTAVREVSPHATLLAIANGKAEQAWLEELGASTTFDALGETAEAVLKRLRSSL